MSEGRAPLQALRQGSLSSAHATLPANEQMWAQDGATGKRVISPEGLGLTEHYISIFCCAKVSLSLLKAGLLERAHFCLQFHLCPQTQGRGHLLNK